MKSKYILLIIVVLAVLFTLIGTEKMPSQIEIENFEVVNIVGLDKTDTGVEITVLRNGQGPSESGEQNPKSTPFSIQASSYVEAIQKLKTNTDKYMTITHTDYYLIGQKAAKEDINDIVDFLSRIYKVSFSSQILIVDNMSSKTFLENMAQEDYSLQDNLTEVFSNLLSKNYTIQTNLVDILDSFLQVNDVIGVPLVSIGSDKVENKQDSNIINCEGVVYINDNFDMCLKLSAEDTLNYNLIMGDVEYFQVNIDGVHFGLIDKMTKVSFDVNNNKIEKIKINIVFDAKIEQADTDQNIFTKDKTNYFESALSEQLRSRIIEIVNKSFNTNIDFLKIEKMFYTKHPYVYRKISNVVWEQIKEAKVDVEAICKIVNTYDVQESNLKQKE